MGDKSQPEQPNFPRETLDATPTDLKQFGMIPEFIGRLPILVSLHKLDEHDLIKILTVPKNAIIPQFNKLLALDNTELTITPCALQAVAEEAYKNGTGARGLRSILERTMESAFFDSPDEDLEKVVINGDVVRGIVSVESLYERRQDKLGRKKSPKK